RRWLNRFGEEQTIRLCETDNSQPSLTLRFNPLKVRREDFEAILRSEGIAHTPSSFLNEYFKLKGSLNIGEWGHFKRGLCTVQDAAGGLPVRLLSPESGDTILDICAAPGGKATYIAELVADDAFIMASDIQFKKSLLLADNVRRLGIRSVKVVVCDGTTYSYPEADKILLDVPCSGTGVISKRSDLRWKRKEKDIEDLAELQLSLLHNAAHRLREGGVIVYSTCTMEEEENRRVIERFLGQFPNFSVEPADNFVPIQVVSSSGFVETFPHVHGIDGSFAARLSKL
ncbi:MAG: RsmB/NOP family class I SAM-dependent RNA methyltransferase, partial [Fidelibacterota bacterium]